MEAAGRFGWLGCTKGCNRTHVPGGQCQWYALVQLGLLGAAMDDIAWLCRTDICCAGHLVMLVSCSFAK